MTQIRYMTQFRFVINIKSNLNCHLLVILLKKAINVDWLGPCQTNYNGKLNTKDIKNSFQLQIYIT